MTFRLCRSCDKTHAPVLFFCFLFLFSSYCPRAMKTVKAFLHGRPSYLVSGLASREEVNLAVALGTPLLGVDGQRAAILGSKSGARDIFEAAEVNVTTGVSGINDLESLTTCKQFGIP